MTNKKLAALALPTLLGSALAPAAAAQEPATPEPTIPGLRLSMEAVRKKDLRQLPAARGKAAAAQFLEESARRGRRVDAKGIEVAQSHLGEIAWEKSTVVDEVRLVNGVEEATGEEVGFAIGMKTGEAEDPPDYQAGGGVGGLGMGDLSNPTGVVGGWPKGGCATYKHPDGHKATSCWQKFKVVELGTTHDSWVYNRHGVARARDDGNLYRYNVKQFTLRAKPWSGTRDRVRTVLDWWPHGEDEVCQKNGKVGVNFYFFAAELPFGMCEKRDTFVDATDIELETHWQGANGTQASLDAAVGINTFAGQELRMADYTWAVFGEIPTLTPWQIGEHPLWAHDSGW